MKKNLQKHQEICIPSKIDRTIGHEDEFEIACPHKEQISVGTKRNDTFCQIFFVALSQKHVGNILCMPII